MIDKEKIKAIIQQYANKGEILLEESYAKGEHASTTGYWDGYTDCAKLLLKEIDSLQEEPDPYIQYASRESAIKAHAEDYSWNIESELFQQLTPEQQKLWRKEIEQACISGGYSGLNLAKDPRYKENLEVKEMDLENELKEDWLFADKTEVDCLECMCLTEDVFVSLAKKYFKLGLKAMKGE